MTKWVDEPMIERLKLVRQLPSSRALFVAHVFAGVTLLAFVSWRLRDPWSVGVAAIGYLGFFLVGSQLLAARSAATERACGAGRT